jgi:hypothetical protein
MRKQAANRARSEKALRDAAEDPFAEPAVAVSPGHNQIGVHLLRNIEQPAFGRSGGMFQLLHCDGNVMVPEVPGHIVDKGLRLLFHASIDDFNNCDG